PPLAQPAVSIVSDGRQPTLEKGSAPMQPSAVTIRTPQALARPASLLERTLTTLTQNLPEATPFEVELPGHPLRCIGKGVPAFRLVVRNPRGMQALATLDERHIGDAYLDCDLDIEGDLLAALSLRAQLRDRHPLFQFWSTCLQPLLFGQVCCDR